MLRRLKTALPLLAFVTTIGTTGCGMNGSAGNVGASSAPSSTLQRNGSVYGGQNPIVGAYVQLYAVGVSGYGSGATPLIQTQTVTDGTTQSTVQTVAGGLFSITGKYTCPSSTTQVYITAVGGNPGDGVNKQAALMAALGSCGNLSSSTFINIDEVTTVAAIWALQGFSGYSATGSSASLYNNGGSNNGSGTTTPATGFAIGSSSTNTTGLANAMLVASILANTTTGTSPGNNSSGTITGVEYGTVNLLGNILAGCINSQGGTAGDNSTCGNMFTYTTPSGGAAPQDTIQAALQIAQNPSTNVSNLVGLAPSSPPFTPAAASNLNDFTIAYNVGNVNSVSGYNGNLASPAVVAFDNFGNAWVYNMDTDGTNGTTPAAPYYPYISEFDAAGNFLTKITQYVGPTGSTTTIGSVGSSTQPSNNHAPFLVVDSDNTVYAEDHPSGNLFAIRGSTAGGVASAGAFTSNAISTGITAASGGAGSGIQNLALDGQGSLWFNAGAAGVSPFSTSSGVVEGLSTSSFTSGTATNVVSSSTSIGSNTYGLAIDNTSSSTAGGPFIWATNYTNCTGTSSLGTTASGYGDLYPVNSNTSGTATRGAVAAFKGLTDVGVSTTSCTATSYPNLLATVSTSYNGTSYQAAPIAAPFVVQIDASNNVWIINTMSASAVSGTGAGQYGTTPNVSVTHISITPGASALTTSNVAESTGGGIASTAVGGSSTYASVQGAIDGSGRFWAVNGAASANFVTAFSYNSTSSSIVPFSPSTGFTGSTCNSCSATVGTTSRKSATRKTLSIDRSGNVWSPNIASNGAYITVVVGAATPVATPLLPSTAGTRP